MIGDADLLSGVAEVVRVPIAARLRRLAVALLLAAGSVGVVGAVRAVVWDDAPARARATGPGSPAASTVVPSAVLDHALATGWTLLDLGFRSDQPGAATVTARFEAPGGAPARPERLLDALARWSSADLVPVAVVATPSGTAVEVRGSVGIDRSPRPGGPVDPALLPVRIAEVVARAGAEPLGVRQQRPHVLPDGRVEQVAADLPAPADPLAPEPVGLGPAAAVVSVSPFLPAGRRPPA